MNVKGEHEFKVSREKLWAYLMDPEVLAKITPGVTKLEILEADTYKSISDIKIGPVKGSFKGKLKVQDKKEPASFAINMEQLSKIGNAHATIAMILEEKGANSSALSFDGKANLSGVIARTGQRVLSGVANAITKEVFASLEKHIEEDQGAANTVIKEETKIVSAVEEKEKQEATQRSTPEVEAQKEQPSVKQEPEVVEKVETKKIVEEKTTKESTQTTTKESAGIIALLKKLFGMK